MKYYSHNHTNKILENYLSRKNILLIFFILNISFSKNFAQDNLELFPSNLLVHPFVANTLEPKLGFEFKTDKNELSLNVGNSLDILHYSIDEKNKISIGADLFTYTLLRSQNDFHFPVDAVDYLFGVNFGYKKIFNKNEFGTRLRLSHISAHFVDGHFDKDLNQWRDNRNPKVYSREFFELIPFIRISALRIYFGLTYIYKTDPKNIGQDQYQIGFDYFISDLISENLTPYFAYDFRLINIYSYTGNNSLETGLKFGQQSGKGLKIYLRYFNGYNIHGEYFDIKENFTSFGFNLDL
ncbi:MAG: DUF1207 domain-containing protein [Ignavibacteriae bacterium]|nr:DUF1207 domain-containing protein [Ignavibacteriota bacterium]